MTDKLELEIAKVLMLKNSEPAEYKPWPGDLLPKPENPFDGHVYMCMLAWQN